MSARTRPSPAAPPAPPAAPAQRRGPTIRAATGALLAKDLQRELRTKEALPSMALFAIATFVVFHFAIDRDTVDGSLAAGVLWVTVLFAAVLAINRLFVSEREEGGFDGFLLAPVDRTAMLAAKAIALLVSLALLQVVAVAAFSILLLGPDPWAALPRLILVLALADIGIAVIGTLISALAIQTRARDLIGPLLTLPLLVPVIIGAAEATAPLLGADGPEALPGRWLAMLSLYDAVFGLLALAMFDYLLED